MNFFIIFFFNSINLRNYITQNFLRQIKAIMSLVLQQPQHQQWSTVELWRFLGKIGDYEEGLVVIIKEILHLRLENTLMLLLQDARDPEWEYSNPYFEDVRLCWRDMWSSTYITLQQFGVEYPVKMWDSYYRDFTHSTSIPNDQVCPNEMQPQKSLALPVMMYNFSLVLPKLQKTLFYNTDLLGTPDILEKLI